MWNAINFKQSQKLYESPVACTKNIVTIENYAARFEIYAARFEIYDYSVVKILKKNLQHNLRL
jgi:hypothetical protein